LCAAIVDRLTVDGDIARLRQLQKRAIELPWPPGLVASPESL
jgi:hypothetical protein